MTSNIQCGPILSATVTVADLAATTRRYAETLGYQADAAGTVSADQAGAWGAPAMAGRRWQLLRPDSGEPGWICLVEGTRPADYRPLAHHGWASMEILLRDTDAMHERMKGTDFTIIGEPHPLKASPEIKAMQVIGPDGEALYLTNVPKGASPAHELPQPKCDVDRIFIMVLGVPDFDATHADLEAKFGLKKTTSRTRGINFLGDGYGLEDEGKPLPMSTVQLAGRCVIQVDGMQPAATPRPCTAGELPPGVALVTLAYPSLAALEKAALGPSCASEGAGPVAGRCLTVRGAGGELYEVIETSG